MENLRSKLEEFVIFLKPFLDLANAHCVTYMTNHTWEKVVPSNIRKEVETLTAEGALKRFWNERQNGRNLDSELGRFVEGAEKHVVERTEFCLAQDALLEKFPTLLGLQGTHVRLKGCMAQKKMHEVEIMSNIVGRVCNAAEINHVLDIGSGKGYLTSVLVLQHGLRILGIDGRSVNIHGAAKRTQKLEKYWHCYKKKSELLDSGNVAELENIKKKRKKRVGCEPYNSSREKCASNEEYYEKYKFQSAILGDSYKQREQYISDDTDLSSILEQEYETDAVRACLTGLHTCGNLAASCLRIFANPYLGRHLNTVVNVGCCYHAIEEEFTCDQFWHEWTESVRLPGVTYGFPLSQFLRNKTFQLGRDARMCATQIPEKIFYEKDLMTPTRALYYRALLQVFLMRKFHLDDFPRSIVGRLANKCDTFFEYVTKAVEKLKVNVVIDEDELQSLQDEFAKERSNLMIFFLMKNSLATVIESVILLDRLLFLYEQGIENAFVAKLFDPILSPRCYAIIACKENAKHE